MPDDPVAVASLPEASAGQEALVRCLAGVERGEVVLDPSDGRRVISFLSHESRKVRRHAAGAVAAMLAGDRITREACREALASGSDEARWGAAFALSRSGFADQGVLAVALDSLDSPDGDRRWAAEAMLVEVARESDVLRRRLRHLAEDGTARSRKMALLCLCDCGERDGALFRSALADPDPYVRMAALTSLARNGDRSDESMSAISVSAEGDDDARVRRAAAAVLRRLSAHVPKEHA